MESWIVFDIGGTTTRVGVARGGMLDEIHLFDTPRDPQEGIGALGAYARDIFSREVPQGWVGDIAGVVKDGVVIRSHHVTEWNGCDIARQLGKLFNTPVHLFNDAGLVGLGEYVYGAGRGSKVMAYVTVSTGVGGARIVDGVIDQGEYNAEIGHQLVDGIPLEKSISGSAIREKYGVHPKDLKDPVALSALAKILARGLYDTTLHWSPDTIVLGGSMITGENALPFSEIKSELEGMVQTIYPHAPRLCKATLSKLGGLYGGMAYAMNKTFPHYG